MLILKSPGIIKLLRPYPWPLQGAAEVVGAGTGNSAGYALPYSQQCLWDAERAVRRANTPTLFSQLLLLGRLEPKQLLVSLPLTLLLSFL